MHTIILQRFANREYRLTHQNIYSGGRSAGDKYKEKQAEKHAQAVHDTYVLQQELQQGEAALISDGKLHRREFGEVDARLGLRALDIINEFQTNVKTTKKGGWGHLSKPTSFTKNARHRLLEAGAIVDKTCGLNAWEVTCTLPGGTTDAIRTLAENTGWMMNELTQIIRRAKCKYWFYVWEFQRRGALHLHLLVADPERNLEYLARKIEARWWLALEFLSEKNQRDLFARRHGGSWRDVPSKWQSHIAPIKKSVAAYFSKYAGKGLKPSLKISSQKFLFLPSRWWGCSTEIKAQIKDSRQKWSISVSSSVGTRIEKHLKTWLADRERIKNYSYEFQLGKTANGTELGGGEVWINYYSDAGFARMQQWETVMWDGVLAIAKECHEVNTPCADAKEFSATRYADLFILNQPRKPVNELPGSQIRTPSPSPHSQQSSLMSKLRNARGTQAQPTLALRALIVQFLAGGGGEVSTDNPDNSQQLSIPGLTIPLTPY